VHAGRLKLHWQGARDDQWLAAERKKGTSLTRKKSRRDVSGALFEV